MSLTTAVSEFSVDVLSRLGLPGVFLLMVLESALVPIPSEVVMVFSGFLVYKGLFGFVEAVMAGTLGNLVGSLVAYYLGLSAGRPFILKYGRYLLLSEHHVASAEEFFQRRGSLAVFLGRMLPAVRTVISFPAGVARMDAAKFSVLTFLGSIPWNTALVLAGYHLGENWAVIESHAPLLDTLGVGILALIAIYYFMRTTSRRKLNQ
ncbi:DedA family protein [Infirmifilum lucidum]|uniref:DedA family protein n=1 Tax=Infirmifilum lucidum TaxID=2776706 RepID=A0A7L9FGR9_9CREN|nr:DedA family protein [Infirmifilum lucidum]QOJ78949.1 DedA family protein [Infirmifilum lucidum]